MYKVLKSKPDWTLPGPSAKVDPKQFVARMRELDREFARQTKQLTALTKRLGRKLKP